MAAAAAVRVAVKRGSIGLCLVDVGLLRHLRISEIGLGLSVQCLVPQQGSACALFGFQRGLFRLQLFDEVRHIGLVGFPEQRHGYGEQNHECPSLRARTTDGALAERCLKQMFETELKFQVPAARWAALAKAVATQTAAKLRLQALYVETPGHDLAAAGLALRLRKEGRVWVQTLKGRGDGLLQRLEHEVRLPAQRGLPQVDPALHDGTPAGAALRKVLAAAKHGELKVLYRTDIQRITRRVRHGGAVVEVALDHGAIHADGKPPLAVAEIEFELLSGPPQALALLAARWAARFDLWWDVRTKSERGFRLALGLRQVPATRARAQTLPVLAGDEPTLAPLLAAMLDAALAHALPNLAELAGVVDVAPAPAPEQAGSSAKAGKEAKTEAKSEKEAQPEWQAPAAVARTSVATEHLHQLRVALRRLRTALSLFGPWATDPTAAAALECRWRTVFTRLGAARDADVLAATWLPRLQVAGAPPLNFTGEAADMDVGPILRDAAVTVLLMDTLAFSLGQAQAAAAASAQQHEATATATAARAVLRRAWRHAWADAQQFGTAPLVQQHRARKRLKKLRYALEFTAPLLPARPLRQWLRALKRAAAALGEHNDLQTARNHFAACVQQQPQAWFAVGWLAAQDATTRSQAQLALTTLKHAPRPWKKRA